MTTLRVSTLAERAAGDVELGVIYASVDGVNERSFHECFEGSKHQAHALGATAIVGLQLVQSQLQWNQRTILLGTALKSSEK